MNTPARIPQALLAAAPLVLACESRVDVTVYGEAFVEEGIPSEEVSDGWRVVFDEFLISMTEVRIDGEQTIDLDGSWVFDLTQPSDGQGHVLESLPVARGRYSSIHYRFSQPDADARGNATAEQIDRVIAAGAALMVEATAARGEREVRFSWAFTLDQGHRCQLGLDARSESSTAQITVHADHLLLDDLMVDPQIAVDLIADADNDGDGVVTTAELATVDITKEARYQTGGQPIDDLYGFVGHLALTMGHVNGEGGCDPELVPRRYRELYEDGGLEVDAAHGSAGAELYSTHCASCHGELGLGDGPLADGSKPRPADLTRLPSAALDPSYLHYRIAEGGAFFPYMSTMPRLAGVLDEGEIAEIVAHVHTLAVRR